MTLQTGGVIVLSLRRTRAFVNEKQQMSESEEKEMIVNPFRTSGFSFQQEKSVSFPSSCGTSSFRDASLGFT